MIVRITPEQYIELDFVHKVYKAVGSEALYWTDNNTVDFDELNERLLDLHLENYRLCYYCKTNIAHATAFPECDLCK